MPRALVLALACAGILAVGCRARATEPPKKSEPRIVWHSLGSWSGSGSLQTESFTSDTGTLRIKWEVAPVAPAAAKTAEPGRFVLEAHSAISGRLLQPVVDQTGPGQGVGYVQQDPHIFYMVVDSSRLNWKFTVEEAIEYP